MAWWVGMWLAVDLDWRAPQPPCPPATAVLDAISREVDAEATHGLRVRGVIAAAGQGLRLELEIARDGRSAASIVLEDPSCQVLVEAAALKVAAVAEAARPEPPPRPPRSSEVADREPSCAPQPRDARATTPCVSLRAWAGGQSGPLPRFGPGLGGGLALTWHRLRLETEAHGWFEQATASSRPFARVRHGAGTVLACGRLGRSWFEAPLCGGLDVGAVVGEGVGVDAPKTDRLVWFAVLAQAGVSFRVQRHLILFARGGVGLDVLPAHFVVNDTQTIYEVPRWSGRVAGGLEVLVFRPRR